MSWLKYDLFSRVRPSFRPFLFKFGRTFMLSKFIPSKGFPSYNYFIKTHTRFDNFFDRHPYLSFGVGAFNNNPLLFAESSYKEVKRRSHMYDFSKRLGFKNSPNVSMNPRFTESNSFRDEHFDRMHKVRKLKKRQKFNAHPYASPSVLGSGVKVFSKKISMFPKEHIATANTQQKNLKATLQNPFSIYKIGKQNRLNNPNVISFRKISGDFHKLLATRRKKRRIGSLLLFGGKAFKDQFKLRRRHKLKAVRKFFFTSAQESASAILSGFENFGTQPDKSKGVGEHFSLKARKVDSSNFITYRKNKFWLEKGHSKKKKPFKIFRHEQRYKKKMRRFLKKALIEFSSGKFFLVEKPLKDGSSYLLRGKVLDDLKTLKMKIKNDFFVQGHKGVGLISEKELRRISLRRLRWWLNKRKNTIFVLFKRMAILKDNFSPFSFLFDKKFFDNADNKVIRKKLGLFKNLKMLSSDRQKKFGEVKEQTQAKPLKRFRNAESENKKKTKFQKLQVLKVIYKLIWLKIFRICLQIGQKIVGQK